MDNFQEFYPISVKILKSQRVNRTTRSNKGTKRNVCPPTFFILSKLHIARDETSEHRSAMISKLSRICLTISCSIEIRFDLAKIVEQDYSILQAQRYIRRYFSFFLFLHSNLWHPRRHSCKNSSKCKNRMLNRFVREICVYFFYLYSKCIRVFFFSFSFFVYTCLCSMYLCISFDECIKDIRMTGLKDLHHAPAQHLQNSR